MLVGTTPRIGNKQPSFGFLSKGATGWGCFKHESPSLVAFFGFFKAKETRCSERAGGVAANKRQLVRHVTQQGIHPLVSEDVAAPGRLCLRNLNFQQAGPWTPVPKQLPDP